MLSFIFNRAVIMFAQVTSGSPVGASPAGESAPATAPMPMPVASPGGIGTMAAKAPAVIYSLSIWQVIFLMVYFLVCVGLVVSVLLQTTKSEGLSGIIGGTAQSVFKGKKGFEDRLKEATNVLAVSFIVLSLLLSVLIFRK